MKFGERIDGPSCPYGYKWREYVGTIYKGRNPKTGQPSAVKIVPYKDHFTCTNKPVERERRILRVIGDHPNIVRLNGMWRFEGAIHFFFDYVKNNLEELIKPSSTPISPIKRKDYMKQILSGIAHCHSLGVIHRHLEPRFLLVDQQKGTVQIAEFGEALGMGNPNAYSRLGDPNFGYRAPELLLRTHQFSRAADVWAVGCIFAAMVRQEPLFHGSNYKEELDSIFSLLGLPDESIWPGMTSVCHEILGPSEPYKAKDLRMENWGHYGLEDAGIDLLLRMLTLDPKERITAEDALNHPYFADESSETTMFGKRKFQDISDANN